MAEKRLKITINKKGEITYTVEGVAGTGCMTEALSFLDKLGTVTKKEKTDDYYKQGEEENWIHIGES